MIAGEVRGPAIPFEAIEAAALKAATAIEKAHGAAVTTAVNGYTKVGTAAAATATAQVNGVNRIAAATKKQADDADAQAERNLRTRTRDGIAREALTQRGIDTVKKAEKAKADYADAQAERSSSWSAALRWRLPRRG